MTRRIAAAAACGLVLLAGCGSEDEKQPAAADATPVQSQERAAITYEPTSDVTGNAAIGKDVAAIRALLEPEQEGAKPDFTAAAQIWSEGRFSKKSDGTNRTLAGFVEEHPVGTRVAHALAGRGAAAGLSDEARVEWIDKGMVVTLKVHALDELGGAKEKLGAGELDPQEGAVHNVDEAWAYFDAEGEGVVATAAKRAKDFGLGDHALADDVVAAIAAARQAVEDEDAAALDAAAETARGAMNRIFALAVKKYAVESTAGATERAEGLAFSWGLDGQLAAADLKTIQDALGAGAGGDAAQTVAGVLDRAAAKLGFAGPLPAYPAAGS